MSEQQEPKWLTFEQVIAIHGRELRRFGGALGLRDEGLLRSAFERPHNKWHYNQANLAARAAAYGFCFAKNHAFVDGNKRIAFMTTVVFLRKNGVAFRPDQTHATAIILALAAGEVSEDGFARWIRDNWPKG